MKIFKSTVLIAFAIVLCACSTYKAREDGFGKMGYKEKRLDDGSYMLSYYGSSFDNEEDVREKWSRRATELCQGNQYKAEAESKEWTYDGYTVLPPLLFKSKGASPLMEGKLMCMSNDEKANKYDKNVRYVRSDA